jgi:hypothetical protein
MSEHDNKKCKVAYCKCGIRVVFASALPHAEISRESRRAFLNYSKAGHIVDYITVKEMKEAYGGCDKKTCWKDNTPSAKPGEGGEER